MTTITLSGYIARETEKAVGFLATAETTKPLWIPVKKIAAIRETDGLSVAVSIAGETIARNGIPVEIDVDAAFLEKIQG
jgi:hypothetical protein